MSHPSQSAERAAAAPGSRRPPSITVTINNQDVELNARRLTGLEIKQAAIAQGVEAEPTFQLSVKHGHRYEVIGDTDTITVHEGEEFLIVAPDDNS